MNRLNKGDTVRHFKGGLYLITDIVLHTEDDSILVIYTQLETGKGFARPYDMFMGKVDKDKYPDVAQEYRMEKVIE